MIFVLVCARLCCVWLIGACACRFRVRIAFFAVRASGEGFFFACQRAAFYALRASGESFFAYQRALARLRFVLCMPPERASLRASGLRFVLCVPPERASLRASARWHGCVLCFNCLH